MAVGNTYFLKGITEGAGTEYKEPEQHEDDPTGGITFWEGDALLDWGNGLQLTVPSSVFEGKSKAVQLVLSYTQDYTDYDDIQLFYGDWSSMITYNVGEQSFTGDFIPSSVYSTGSGESHVTAFSFDESTLNTILKKGIVIQGHGIRLTQVSINDPAGIHTPMVSPTPPAIYTIDGRQISQPLPGHIYIQNGKKIVFNKQADK